MATDYLNKNGLSYFWSKIKAWCNATFAAIAHNQASNTINAMTGYSKPSSGSAIGTGDTLNQAIGKLEAKVDAYDDSNYVHKTGNESISGQKRFLDRHGLILVNNDVSRGTAPSSSQYRDVLFEETDAKNLGEITMAARATSDSTFGDSAIDLKLWVYPYTETITGDVGSFVGCGWDKNGIPFAMCTGTSEDRTYGGDILTRNWIPKDTRIVHTTGDETVGGIKTYTDTQRWNARVARRNTSVAYGYNGEDSSITKGTAPSDNSTHHFAVDFYGTYARDYKDRIAMFQCRYFADKTSSAGIYAYKCNTAQNDTAEHISIYYPPSGDPYTYAPTPATSSNTTSIATTAWVRTFCDTTQKYMKSVSVTGSGNAVTAASLSNGTLTLTKGASYVTVDSAQTITGSKTFSTSGSLLMPFRSTAVQRNTNVSSNATCGFSFAEKNNVNISLVEGFVYPSKNTGLSFLTRKWASTDSTFRGVQLIWQNNDDIFLRPADANLDNIYLGGSSYRWKAVYSANGSIQTSDERMKSEIGFIPDAVLDAWADVDFCQFKFNAAVGREGREAARFHTGVVAQKVQKAFSGAGLDASRYGLFCYDRWDAEPEQLREDGTVLQSAREAGDMYSMRYEEALCMEAAYMRRENARLKKRVADLEERLAALELRLGSE